jgi:hypothetical protein
MHGAAFVCPEMKPKHTDLFILKLNFGVLWINLYRIMHSPSAQRIQATTSGRSLERAQRQLSS